MYYFIINSSLLSMLIQNYQTKLQATDTDTEGSASWQNNSKRSSCIFYKNIYLLLIIIMFHLLLTKIKWKV